MTVLRNKQDLIFTDIAQTSFNFKLPLFIDNENHVLLGNSRKEHLNDNDKINCIVCENNEFIKNTLYFIEKVVIEENDINRIASIDEELNNYLLDEFDKTESFTLFDFKEEEIISESNFIKPPEYNFEKAKRNKNKEEEEINDDDLFGWVRGL